MGGGGGGRAGGVFWQESTRQERPFLFFKMVDSGVKKGPETAAEKHLGALNILCRGFGIAWSGAGTTFHLFQDRRYGQGRTDLIPTGVFPTPQKLLTSLNGGFDARLLKDGFTG